VLFGFGNNIYLSEKGENKMLFMTILTWEPEKRDELFKRFAEKGTVTGGKILGQWNAIAGGRAFRLVDVDDPKAAFATCNIWNDVGKLEIIPIIESEQVRELMSKK
jgi:hypothetical protein